MRARSSITPTKLQLASAASNLPISKRPAGLVCPRIKPKKPARLCTTAGATASDNSTQNQLMKRIQVLGSPVIGKAAYALSRSRVRKPPPAISLSSTWRQNRERTRKGGGIQSSGRGSEPRGGSEDCVRFLRIRSSSLGLDSSTHRVCAWYWRRTNIQKGRNETLIEILWKTINYFGMIRMKAVV